MGCGFSSCPVSFPETDGGFLWGNLSPVSFPETAGVFLSGNLPRGLFGAHGAPQHSFVCESCCKRMGCTFLLWVAEGPTLSVRPGSSYF